MGVKTKSWIELQAEALDMIDGNEYLSDIERGPAKELVRKHFQLMRICIGNLELVRRRAEQKDLVF